MSKKISGTREWAVANVNCYDGCQHNCRYCYARNMAMRFGRIADPKDWAECHLRESEVKKRRMYRQGTIMFPTTHDITPETMGPCLEVLHKLLAAGNKVLIVTKPHLSVVEEMCKQFEKYKESILFRFTIGAFDDGILGYWEPGAPHFLERFSALKHAFAAGFQTSVSVEPMLDSDHVIDLFYMLEQYVTDAIWIGKMNKVRLRVPIDNEEDERQVQRIEAGQTDANILRIYKALKQEARVKWKESVKEVVGLPAATQAGTDA